MIRKEILEKRISSLTIQIDSLKKDIQSKEKIIDYNKEQLRLNKFKLHKVNQEIGPYFNNKK